MVEPGSTRGRLRPIVERAVCSSRTERPEESTSLEEFFVSKRLVICCDGTWNTPDQADDGRPALTNVAKVALSIAPSDGAGVEQRVHYQHGVGVSRWEHILGGVFGYGLSRNVREAYRLSSKTTRKATSFFSSVSAGARLPPAAPSD